jgi:diaminopimelate decarboxylase
VPYEDIVRVYRKAKALGAKRFGLHTMVCSNTKTHHHVVKTVELLLKVAIEIRAATGIELEFINMGGGIGIPYSPEDPLFDIEALGRVCWNLMEKFESVYGFKPKLVMESGRFMTGPHGVLVNTAINKKVGYNTYIGVEVAMAALMRPAIYGAYHDIVVVGPDGRVKTGELEKVSIVGPICENCDRLATDRMLPHIDVGENIGDFIVTANCAAHADVMSFTYNGRTRPPHLMLRRDRSVELTCRAETKADLIVRYLAKPTKIMLAS